MPRRLALLLACAWACQAADPLLFLQATDPQFGMYEGNAGMAQEEANFEFFVATANRLKPAFVVMTGDLVNRAGDAAQIAAYQRIAARLDQRIRLYNVPGNHDVGDAPTPELLAAYRHNFGRDYYSFREAGVAFVVLNSVLIHSPQKAGDEPARQEAWLRKELAQIRADGIQRVIVFQHHPWFLLHPEEPDQYFNIPLERRTRYLKLFAESGVTHVFAGHYHINAAGRAGQIELVTTGPVGKPRGNERSGFRSAIVSEQGVGHTYHDFGAVPNRIELTPPAKK